ncbi:uncharacterized protein LOC118436791 [Folsomia candida]|uniref:uncharacterized protein LOC118436791 n=1 Tax=Folsomia candida TaxID=158441 RepID=UPI001604DD9F|nr:uncharacterized protein LOC118436791 [Folsomia candida]
MASASQTVRFDTSDSESDLENQPEAKRRKLSTWECWDTFENITEAKKYLKDRSEWVYKTKYASNDGDIIVYNCRISPTCSSKCRIILPSSTLEVRIEKSVAVHDHVQKDKGLSAEVKEEIIKLHHCGTTKPKAIIGGIESKGIKTPTKGQLDNFLKYWRKQQAPQIVSLGALESECLQLKEDQQDVDKAFVLNKDIDYETKTFRIYITTRRLLQIAELSTAVHSDATYKLCWQGYPVILTGVSDQDRTFHPTGMAVTSAETSADFKFIFESLKMGTSEKYKPTILIADAAESITNGFKEVFGCDITRIYCWFHLCKNIDARQSTIKNKELWRKLRGDVNELQLARSPEDFLAAKELFLKKYRTEADLTQFMAYFKQEHLDTRDGWYEGHCMGFPSTNNGIEGTNAWIKRQGTFRERLSIGQLLQYMTNQTEIWSKERIPGIRDAKLFHEEPSLSLALQTSAFNWVQNKPDIKYHTCDDNITTYFISAANQPKLKEDDINKYLRLRERRSWKTFDTYKMCLNRLWLVKFNASRWIKSSCSCPVFLKMYVCKHVLGIAIVNKQYEVCPEAKTVPIGTRRCPGRPSKARKALITM